MSLDVEGFKILGAALIFIFGFIGSSVPIMAKQGSKRSVKLAHYLGFVQQLMLALGAGVVLATAFVHILPEGVESLADGGLGKSDDDDDDGHNHSHDEDAESVTLRRHRFSSMSSPSVASTNANSITLDDASLRTIMIALKDEGFISATSSSEEEKTDKLRALITELSSSNKDNSNAAALDAGADVSADSYHNGPSFGHGHSHGDSSGDDDEPYPYAYMFVLIGVAVTFVIESELHRLAGKTQGATMKAHLVEGGIAVHSVLVGIAFGTLHDEHTANTLMIALSFHQLCEGFAIGPLIYRGAHSFWHAMVLVLIFAGSTPLGVGIGALIDAYSDPTSNTAKLTQGIMMLIAAGLLVYVGCVEFLGGLQHDVEHQAEELEHHHEHKVARRKEKKLIAAAAKVVGAEFAATLTTSGDGCGDADGCEDGGASGGFPTRNSFVETWAASPTTHANADHHEGAVTTTADERAKLLNSDEGEGDVNASSSKPTVGDGAINRNSTTNNNNNPHEESDEEAEEHRQIEEMKSDFLSQNPKIARFGTYLSFYVGATLMSVLALWV